MIPPLAAKSRYDLIIAGGNGGEVIFGDVYTESKLRETFAADSWSFTTDNQSGSNWDIDLDAKSIAKKPSNDSEMYNDLLACQSNRLANCDIRANLSAFTNGKKAGFIVRNMVKKGISSQYRIVITNSNGSLHLCVSHWQSTTTTPHKLTDQTLPEVVVSDEPHLRINVFHNHLKVFVDYRLIKEVDLKEESIYPLVTEGSAGILASKDVTFTGLQLRLAEILKIHFMTGGFESFTDMILESSIHDDSIEVGPDSITATDVETLVILSSQNNYQRWRVALGEVDYQDGSIDRESWENIKQAHREARAQLDEQFSLVCNNATNIYYQPLSEQIEGHLVLTGDSTIGFYIRSPEPLNLSAEIDPELLNEVDGTLNLDVWTTIGSTSSTILKDGADVTTDFHLLRNSDENQILILKTPDTSGLTTINTGSYILRFTHTRNHGDDAADIDHRYDRPVQSVQGIDTPLVAEMSFEV